MLKTSKLVNFPPEQKYMYIDVLLVGDPVSAVSECVRLVLLRMFIFRFNKN